MPRAQINVRDDELVESVRQLQEKLSIEMGVKLSQTDVVRLAIRDLAKKHGCDEPSTGAKKTGRRPKKTDSE